MVTPTPSLVSVLYSFDLAGSERLGATLAEAFAKRGWNVHVCATHAADGPLRAQLEARGIPCTGFDIESHTRLERRCRIYRELAAIQPDVVHVQHFSMLGICNFPARLAGVRRVVVTEHSDQRLRADPGLRRRAIRLARGVDAITAIHPELHSYLVKELRMPAERVHLIPNGVDTDRYQPDGIDCRLGRDLRDQEMVIGCVARLHPDKDHLTLLEAFARLPAGTARLKLVGDGPERSRLEHHARTLGLRDRVEFLGERADVESLMPHFDCFVLASRTEGLPMVLLEAMASGVPCVATAVGGIPSLLNESTGLLVPPGDASALAAALDVLRTDQQHRDQLAKNARAYVTSRYGLERMIDSYAALLQPSAISGNFPVPGCKVRA